MAYRRTSTRYIYWDLIVGRYLSIEVSYQRYGGCLSVPELPVKQSNNTAQSSLIQLPLRYI